MKKLSVLLFAIILSLCFVFSSACVKRGDYLPFVSDDETSEDEGTILPMNAINLMLGYSAREVEDTELDGAFTSSYNELAAKLFKLIHEGDNELISPLSIELALGMTANGAKGRTKTQMEYALFGGTPVETFNKYNLAYVSSLLAEKSTSVQVANSIWMKDDPYFTVESDFLQTNADYYDAAVYKAPFNDQTLTDINSWVSDKTDGMIDKILDEIGKDAIMYLINALLFDAEWKDQFENSFENDFTLENGKVKSVDMLRGDLRGYVHSDLAEGFIKSYKGGRFAFCAMLPNKGVSVQDLVNAMDGKSLTGYFNSAKNEKVVFMMPKFSLNCEFDLIETLAALGMTDAFDPFLADFTALGSYRDSNIYIALVKHKTAIEVTEAGTKAAAVTIVGMEKATSVGPGHEEIVHHIYLDRPFAYFILDTYTNTPLFMGTYEK